MTETSGTTDAFYASQAETYAKRGRKAALAHLKPFCDRLPAGARILELGCGGGEDSEVMLSLGFDVVPTDGTPDMARVAALRLQRPVDVLRFEDIADVDAYDGVWASACLLHVPRPQLAGVLARIRRALRSPGLFYATYKAGTEEGHDRFGRYYNRPDRSWLEQCYREAGWSVLVIEEVQGGGYDGEPTDWLHVTATR